ncbi:MAG TPA: tetratricopeptide repeat protein [Candidatus Limnocylindrales bacterium]|nr:tetratricopeptide repeat protein [Candidatus Limnocylindrales bacterium]
MQATGSSAGTLRFGVFEADLRAAELRKHGIRIKLQEQPFQILALLLRHPGQLVTREELRQELWPAHTFVDFDRGLNKAMTKLRSALGDSAESPRYIETLHRRGYRFLAPVSEVHEDSHPIFAEHGERTEWFEHAERQGDRHADHHGDRHAENGGRDADERAASASGSRHHGRGASDRASTGKYVRWARRHRNIAATAAAFVIGIVGLLAYLRIYHPVVFGGSAGEFGPRQSVAVLGFRNLSGSAQDAWLSTALSDWLITELSAGDQLRTIPAESVARMRIELALPDVDSLGRDSLTRIRRNLGTDYVVAGSYAMLSGDSGGQLRLDLRLQDARTGETVVAVSESGTESRLFDLVADAGEQLRSKLGAGAITSEQAAEVATALPSKSEAAHLYWEGLARLRVFDALAARDLLSKAVEAEPDFALSHSALATAWVQLGYDANANAEAKKAYDLSNDLSRAERLLVEARYRETSRDWQKAIEIYRALFEFFPDNLDYGLALAADQVNAGEGKEALATVAALRNLPAPVSDDPRIDLAKARAAESLGDFKTVQMFAARAAEKAKASGASLLLARARLDEAWATENLGEFDQVDSLVKEAKGLYQAAHDRKGVADAETTGAIALWMEGDYLGAKKGYEDSLAIYREMGGQLNVANESDNIADILFGLGDLNGAKKNYEAALSIYREIGHPDGIPLAKNGLGDVFLTLGMHEEAKKMYEESFEACQQIGDRSKAGVALSGLGRVYLLEGDLEAARKSETRAKEVFDEIGDKSQSMESRLLLAQIFLDEGDNAAAASSAKDAISVFEQTRAKKDQAAAYLLLARALLAQGRVVEARANVDKAVAAADQAHYRELEMLSSIAAARVGAASGSLEDRANVEGRLNALITEATAAGFVSEAMEGRLALGEVEMASGNATAGLSQLQSLEKDAAAKGYRLIEEKAAAARRTAQQTALQGG